MGEGTSIEERPVCCRLAVGSAVLFCPKPSAACALCCWRIARLGVTDLPITEGAQDARYRDSYGSQAKTPSRKEKPSQAPALREIYLVGLRSKTCLGMRRVRRWNCHTATGMQW